jgi:hypothetical protein
MSQREENKNKKNAKAPVPHYAGANKRPAPVDTGDADSEAEEALSPPVLVRTITEIPARKLTLRSRVYTEEERKNLITIFEHRLEDLRKRPLTKQRKRISCHNVTPASPVYVVCDFSDDSDQEECKN